MNTPETPHNERPNLKRHRLSPEKIAEMPMPRAFPLDKVKAIEALGRKHINPFETLYATFPLFQNPLPEEQLEEIVRRMSEDVNAAFTQAKKGPQIPANRIRVFLITVTETLPFPPLEDFDKYWYGREKTEAA